jgi:flagellar assembly protein FliH
MKSWPETLRFSRPLKDARLSSPPAAAAGGESAERERAAYEKGRIDGERALGEQLVRQRSELLELQQGVLSSLRGAVGRVTSDCEGACVQLALAVARKVVSDLPDSAGTVEAAVREALADVERGSRITVLLNVEDLALLQRQNSPMLLAEAAGEGLRLEPSPEVTRGGCLVRTSFGAIDARRETKFALLEKSILN